jgi:hypothetical protein
MNANYLRFVPLEELQKPKTGYEVLVDFWWIVHPDKGAVFYQRNIQKKNLGSPQCNRDKNVTELVHSRLYTDMEIRQIPLAYILRDYD